MRKLIAKILYRLVGDLVKEGKILTYVDQCNAELINAGCDPLDDSTIRVVEKWQGEQWEGVIYESGTVSMRRDNA